MEAARRVYAELDSTMAEAARLAEALAGPTWILAHHQTAARGRRGRPWRHPKGNFAATLVMPAPPLGEAALRSFVAALALYDTLTALDVAGCALKWPNDVLVDGAKVAGILLETLPQSRLAIGIGINLRAAPAPETLEPGAVPAAALGRDIDPEAVLDTLAPAFARWEAQLAHQGFAPIRAAWLSRAARLGTEITARMGHTRVVGVFESIDIDGQLVLSTQDGRRTIPAAEVYF